MNEAALNFARYAPEPERPRLAWSQPGVPSRPGELGQVAAVIRNALALIRQCLRIACAILWRRTTWWVKIRVLHSLSVAWLLCGGGWGGLIGISVAQYLVR